MAVESGGGILDIIQRRNPETEFDILKQIGSSGKYGEVYKARLKKTNELVALKIIKIEPTEDFNIIQQEIAILAECKHHNIIGYNGSYLRRDRIWIAMEYCGGGSLQDIYQTTGTGLNELQIAFVCREILKGLQYLHERQKIHRNIKGSNILLTDSGDVKLADFSMATKLTLTLQLKRKSFVGTPYWMAPEIAAVEKKGGINQLCDIWGLGITAIELAETQPPMFDLHPVRALYLMIKRDFKPPGLQYRNKWSENFHEFLKFALQKEPRKRPTAAELLKHEFVNRSALCAPLMLSLICILGAPPPKPKTPVDEDPEEDDRDTESDRKKNMKRIPSVKNKDVIHRQAADAEMFGLQIPVPPSAQPSRQELPAWLAHAADDPSYKPRIQRISAVPMREESEYHDPDENASSTSPVSPNAHPPPTPPSHKNSAPPIPPRHREDAGGGDSRDPPVYGNVDPDPYPPVPPRQRGNPPMPTQHGPRIQRISAVPMREDSEYHDPDKNASSMSPVSPNAHPPPTPPSHKNSAPPIPPRPWKDMGVSDPPVYGNVDPDPHPPVPPRQRGNPPTPTQHGPPLPPRQPNLSRSSVHGQFQRMRISESDRRAYFSNIFNGCPLHLNCAASWTHPITKLQYVLLGANEGLFSLLVTNNPDPVMEQVSSRACYWLRVVESALIWLSGNSRFISMTNLILLFQTDSQKEHNYVRNKQHTAKIPDSQGCIKCCICCNHFSDQRFLIAAVSKGLLLMQWYQPQHAFKHIMLFECTVPQPLGILEAFVYEEEEYPVICFGVKETADGNVVFDTMNLNTQANLCTDQSAVECKEVSVLCLQQLEKDTVFLGLERCAKFVDTKGILKPGAVLANQIVFEKKSEHMVYLSNCVLSFHKHGMQGKSLSTQQVTAEVIDESKVYRLLGSYGTIIIETRPLVDQTAPSNIYILVSEDSPAQ